MTTAFSAFMRGRRTRPRMATMQNGWAPQRPPVRARFAVSLEREAGHHGEVLILDVAVTDDLREAFREAALMERRFIDSLFGVKAVARALRASSALGACSASRTGDEKPVQRRSTYKESFTRALTRARPASLRRVRTGVDLAWAAPQD